MKLRALVLAMLIAGSSLVVGGGFAGVAGAGNAAGSCTVIDDPGAYELSGNIADSTEDSCIEITSSDVHFDGMGYTIDGTDDSDTEGVLVHGSGTLTNVTVTNLTVTDWGSGIVFDDSEDIHLTNVTANDNDGRGIFVEQTSNSVIRNATANENRDEGIEIHSRWSNTVIGANLTANGEGIAVRSSNDAYLENVSVRDTTAGDGLNSFGRAILIEFSDDVEIANSTVSNSSDETFITRRSDATVANDFTVDGDTFSFVAEDAELEATDSPPGAPSNHVDTGIFLTFEEAPIGLGSPDPVLNLIVPYTDPDVAAVPDESSLSLWRHDGTDWIEVTDSSVDVGANAVSGNLTETGVVAPLGTDVTPPDANAGSNRTVDVNTEVSFDASGSTDNEGIDSYVWEFGDGATATGATPNHTYSQSGTYAVNLTVADAVGNDDTDTITVTVESVNTGGGGGNKGGSGDDGADPTPTPTETPTDEQTPTPTATPDDEPTETVSSTPTPGATESPTDSPTATSIEGGTPPPADDGFPVVTVAVVGALAVVGAAAGLLGLRDR